jgi:transposase InsO family protein
MDLFGPPSYASLGGKNYCLVIVNDYSRYTWVYFFMFKSETQQTVKDFATEVEHKFNTTILTIRSDNGTEFKNYSLNEFLSDAGIKRQYSAAYTPQQKWSCRDEELDSYGCGKNHVDRIQVSIQLLGQSY